MDKSVDFMRSFECHGISLQTSNSGQAIGECPFCGKEKFYVDRSTGQWECKVCAEKGNLVVFLRKIWDLSRESNDTSAYLDDLAESRGLLSSDTLTNWGTVRSVLTGIWLIPGFNSEGEIVQLYRYLKNKDGKRVLYVTPGLSYKGNPAHGIHWCLTSNIDSDEVYLAEGVWDGMALSEVVKSTSLILAVPGCNVFLTNWASFFIGKKVNILYDNDHSRQVTVGRGIIRQVEGGAITGIKRVVNTLMNYKKTPKSISYLSWGERGFDFALKDGYDLRDHLCQGKDVQQRKSLWLSLSKKIVTIPEEWVVKESPKEININPSECKSWRDLIMSWRKSGMHWPDSGEGLDYALSVMLSCILSTSTQGEPIWIKVVGPPSCGKSVLAEACAVAKKYIKSLSTIRGMYSGYRTTKDDNEDNSLIPLIRNKTLILKEGNTLVKSVNFDRVLSELRDLYDGAGRSHYNNRMGKDYEGIRFTIIICGTEAYMDIFDRSELGERFIDCIVLKELDEESEEEIGWKVALRANSEVEVSSNGTAESLMTPEMLEAKRMTGGYIEYLRGEAENLLLKIDASEESLRYCQRLATFASFMRTKQPLDKGKGHPEIKAQRELSFRLISQFVRLAKCLAVVLGRDSLDESVMTRVKKVGLDTSRGTLLEICHLLYKEQDNGVDTKTLAILLTQEEVKTRHLLQFMRKIGILDLMPTNSPMKITRYARGSSQTRKWRLTDRILRLYELVVLEGVIQ